MPDPAAKRTIKPNGGRIVELRRARGWTQERLAAEADLESKRTISSAERGRPVYLQTIRAIADALNVEIREIALQDSLIIPDISTSTNQKRTTIGAVSSEAEIGQGSSALLPAFKDNEILHANTLNAIVETSQALEHDYRLDVAPLPLYRHHQPLKAESLNNLMEHISKIRRAAGLEVRWEHFPVRDGQVLKAKALNELSANLNEVIKIGKKS